jgi:hypothetical protein
MTFLVILGFVLFATFAVFGIIDTVYKLRTLSEQHEAVIKKIQEDQEKEKVDRLQYLAGIKTKSEVKPVPAKLGPEIVGELLADSEVDLLKDIEEDKEKLKNVFYPVGKQYTRR